MEDLANGPSTLYHADARAIPLPDEGVGEPSAEDSERLECESP